VPRILDGSLGFGYALIIGLLGRDPFDKPANSPTRSARSIPRSMVVNRQVLALGAQGTCHLHGGSIPDDEEPLMWGWQLESSLRHHLP